MNGNSITPFLEDDLGAVTLGDTSIPLCRVATDLQTEKEVTLVRESIIYAISLRIAVSGTFFTPLQKENFLLIDGRLVNALPVIFVNDLPAQAKTLPGHKVFILGDNSGRVVVRIEEKDITIYPLAIGSLRKSLLNRGKMIVFSSRYTTILDLVEINKPAIFLATARQTEQEHLADFF